MFLSLGQGLESSCLRSVWGLRIRDFLGPESLTRYFFSSVHIKPPPYIGFGGCGTASKGKIVVGMFSVSGFQEIDSRIPCYESHSSRSNTA